MTKKDVALVTGGASGLGKAIATRLSRDGFTVAISDVQVELGKATAAESDFAYFEHDVRDEAGWQQVIGAIEADHGPLGVLVNNAGIIGPTDASSPENARLADWQRIFSINVEGVFLGCRSALPAMRRTGHGSIINISSVAGLMATPYNTAYGASKAAVRQLTKSVAQHCAEQGLKIRCNSVHPGDVRTDIWDARNRQRSKDRGIPFEDIVERARANIPLGEFTLPEDVAAAVSFLASDESRQITGTKMIVDGGYVNLDSFGRTGHISSAARAPK